MAAFPNIKPISVSSMTITPRVKRTELGNGFVQIYGDGTNTMKEMWDLTFIVNSTDFTTLHNFFQARKGYDNFTWTAPFPDATQKNYIHKDYSFVGYGNNIYEINVQFEEWVGLT